MQTHHRPKRPNKTDLVVLCDLSESVAAFAHFTLLLVYALREQFSRVRAFGFVDELDELTRFFAPGCGRSGVGDPADAAEADVTWVLGRTDYGRAFELFAQRFPDAVGPKTSLLVLGDARSNYGALALPTLSRAGRPRQARLLAQPRTPRGLGHRRLAGGRLRRDRADGRVPQPGPAVGVRAGPRRLSRSGQLRQAAVRAASTGCARPPTGGRPDRRSSPGSRPTRCPRVGGSPRPRPAPPRARVDRCPIATLTARAMPRNAPGSAVPRAGVGAQVVDPPERQDAAGGAEERDLALDGGREAGSRARGRSGRAGEVRDAEGGQADGGGNGHDAEG